VWFEPASGENVYFGGKMIRSQGVTVATDRLGSVRGNSNGERMAYLPYGQERGNPTTPDGREKFGTYWRDSTMGVDYADQRYYAYQAVGSWSAGRFMSPDPGGVATADPTNPASWNRYAYAVGDPANGNDPTGQIVCFDPDAQSIYDGSCTGDDGGWGGGGGGGLLPAPPPTNPKISRAQYLAYIRQQMALAAAAILAANLQRASSFGANANAAQVPTFLQMSSECWAPAVPTAGTLAYTLEVTYQIEDSTGAAMSGASLAGISVSESFGWVTGGISPQDSPGTWTYGSPTGIQSNGTFTDYLSAGGLPPVTNPSGSAFQSFTASGTLSNGIPMISQPLTVLGFGNAATVLSNTYGPSNVTINGYGLGTNPQTQCH